MSQSSEKESRRSKCFQYPGELRRMSWGDGFFTVAADASLKNLIYFVYLVEWESNLIIDKMFKVVENASENVLTERSAE